MKKTAVYTGLSGVLGLIITLVTVSIMNCSSSSNDTQAPHNQVGGPAGTNIINVDVDDEVNTISLTAGVPTEVSFIFNLSPSAGLYDSVTVNLQETLNSGGVAVAGLNSSDMLRALLKRTAVDGKSPEARMSVRVAPSNHLEYVCRYGHLYGPFTIKGNESNDPVSIDPPTVKARPATVNIINTGSSAICIQIESPVDANVNVDNLEVERTGCRKNPSDILGTWTGTYSCENTGCASERDQDITLTIIKDQDGYHYSESDGQAHYDGHLCGDTFEYEGGGSGYRENGTFTLTGANEAVKTSLWVADDDSCSGECTDHLTRQ